MHGWWPVLLFSICWQVVPTQSRTLLERNRLLALQELETSGAQEPEGPSAERAVAEGVYEVKRLLANDPVAVNIPVHSHDHVPKSPKHRNEISDNDLGEVIDQEAAELSDSVNSKYVAAGMPMDFIGNTCKQVCTMCVIAAEDYPECGCKATCVAGSDDTQCGGKNYGWSSYKVTTPKTSWKAKCNAGGVDCSTCMDQGVIDRIHKCKKELIPAVCEHELKMELAKPDTPIKYCTQDNTEGQGLATCDEFLYEPKENGWTCFVKKSECENSKTDIREALTAHEDNVPILATPCIWCNIPIKK